MTRLFVAARPPDDVRDHLDAQVAQLRETLPGWRWVRPEHWHLTLAFFGEVDERRVPELETRLARAAARHPSLTLALNGLGAFSSLRRATVLWVHVDGDRDAVGALAASVAAAGRRTGVAVEERRYRPHLTLARRRTPVDLTDQLASARDYQGPTFAVADIVLVESHVGAQVEHLDRARFHLGHRA